MTRRREYRGRQFQDGYELRCIVAHWDGVPEATLEDARSGCNRSCVECFRPSLDYGLRCQPCFSQLVAQRKAAA